MMWPPERQWRPTKTVPIVFTTSGSPAHLGFVASLNRPGGNATGITTFGQELLTKRLELIREVFSSASKVALLLDPDSPATSQAEIQRAQVAARDLGFEIIIVSASTDNEIEGALNAAAQQSVGAVLISSDPLLSSRHEHLALRALHHALPTISNDRIAVVAGQLMSYGANSDELYQLAGAYAGRILRGEKPADLPVVQPARFELAVNLKTANALGLTIPPNLLARADEVIE
jgi:putative tryptophan/tyrosine transport system substrate-binding protein